MDIENLLKRLKEFKALREDDKVKDKVETGTLGRIKPALADEDRKSVV